MRLIDADAMKERLGMAHECDDCDDPRACRYDSIYTKRDFCLCIDDEPTVEGRKTGKWIVDDNVWDAFVFKCSKCGYEFESIEGALYINKMRFCPHCGARMVNVVD